MKGEGGDQQGGRGWGQQGSDGANEGRIADTAAQPITLDDAFYIAVQ